MIFQGPMDRVVYSQMHTSEERHWWFVARRRILASVLQKTLPLVPDRRILELGCGSGGNFEMLRQFGEIWGMELDPQARQLAADRGLATVAEGRLPGQIPFEGAFDLICLLDVLEHLEFDQESLEAAAARLAVHGRILITVPAFSFLWSSHDVAHHHFRRYTRARLRSLLPRAGLREVTSTYFNTFLFPPICAIRLLSRLIGRTSAASHVGEPGQFTNRLFSAIFASERHFIPGMGFPYGVSLLLVAELNS